MKLVFIDVDDTLLDFEECSKYAIKKCCEDASIEYSDEIYKVFRPYNDLLWTKIEDGSLTKEQLYGMRWTHIFTVLGIDCDGIAFEENFRHYASMSAVPIKGSLDILEYLSKKYILCTASNASYERQYGRLKKAGMLDYFDKIFASGDVGCQKPMALFFERCMEHFPEISKDDTVIIGDSLTADIAGGKNYGIRTVWFNRQRKPHSGDVIPDCTVYDLCEIKNIL